MFDLLAAASIVAKFVWITTALVAIGLSLHAAARIAPWRRAGAFASVCLAIAIGLRFWTSAAELAGDWNAASDMAGLVWSVQGASICATLVGVAALWIGCLAKSRAALGFAAVAIASAFGLTGHGQNPDAPPYASAVVATHVVIAGFWAVAPLSLWPASSLQTSELAARHRRFGMIALAAVPALFVAGAVLAVSFGGGMAGLTSSAYGGAILVKSALAAAALGVGAWNRLSLARKLAANTRYARAQVQWAMSIDALLFLMIAVATTAATSLLAPTSA